MSYYENLQRKYGYKQLNVARWNDPMGSVHPARGGPRAPLVSPDVANKALQSGYKVMYRRPPPPPTDDEDSADDEEDRATGSTEAAEVAAPPPVADESLIEPPPTVAAPEAPTSSCDNTDAVVDGGATNDTVATDEDRPEPATSEAEQQTAVPSSGDSNETSTAVATDDKESPVDHQADSPGDDIAAPAPIEQIAADTPAEINESPSPTTSGQVEAEIPPPAPEPPRIEEHEVESPVSEDDAAAAESVMNADDPLEAGSPPNNEESHPDEELTGDTTDAASGAPEICTEVTNEEPVTATNESIPTPSDEPTPDPEKSAVDPPSEETSSGPKDSAEEEIHENEAPSQSQPVDIIPQFTETTPDTQLEDDDDKKVSWAPGTTEPKPTIRKKKSSKSSKSKGKKKAFVTTEGDPNDIVAIVNVVDGDDILESAPKAEVRDAADLVGPVATDEPPSTPEPPAEEAQESSIDSTTIPNDGPETPEADSAKQSTTETNQSPSTSPIDDGPTTPAKIVTVGKSSKAKDSKSSKGKDKGKDKSKGKKSSIKNRSKPEGPRVQPEAIVVEPASATNNADTAAEEDIVAPELADEENSKSSTPDAVSTAADVKVPTDETPSPLTTVVVATDDAAVSTKDDEAAVKHPNSSDQTDVPITALVFEEGADIPDSEQSEATTTTGDTDGAGLQKDEQHKSRHETPVPSESIQPDAKISSDDPAAGPGLGSDLAREAELIELADSSEVARATEDPQPEQIEVPSDKTQAEDDIKTAIKDLPATSVDPELTTETAPRSSDDSPQSVESAGESNEARDLEVNEGAGTTADVNPDEVTSSADSNQATEEITKAMADADAAESTGLDEGAETETAESIGNVSTGEDTQSGGKGEAVGNADPADSPNTAVGETSDSASTDIKEPVQDDGALNDVASSEKDNGALADALTPDDQSDGGAADRDVALEVTSQPANSEEVKLVGDGGSDTTIAEKTSEEVSENVGNEGQNTEDLGTTDGADHTVVVILERETELGAIGSDADGEHMAAIDATIEEHSAAPVEEAALNEGLPQASHEQVVAVPDELLATNGIYPGGSGTPSNQDEVSSKVQDTSDTSSDLPQPPATEESVASVIAEEASTSIGPAQEESATTEEPEPTAEQTAADTLDSGPETDQAKTNANPASCDPASTKDQDKVVAEETVGGLHETPTQSEPHDATKETDPPRTPEIKAEDTVAAVGDDTVVIETTEETASHKAQAGGDIRHDAPSQDGKLSEVSPSPNTDAAPIDSAEKATNDTAQIDNAPTADVIVIEQPSPKEDDSNVKATDQDRKAETSTEHLADGNSVESATTESSLANASSETEVTIPASTATSDSAETETSTKTETTPLSEDVQVEVDPPDKTELLKADLSSQADPDVLEQSIADVSAEVIGADKGNVEFPQHVSQPINDDTKPDISSEKPAGDSAGGESEANKGSGEADIMPSENKDVDGDAGSTLPSVDAESARVVPDESLPPADHESDSKAAAESAEKFTPIVEVEAKPQIEPEAPPSPTISKKSSSKRHSKHTERATKRSSHHEKSFRTNDAGQSPSKRSSRHIAEEPRVLHTRQPVRVSMTTAELEEQAARRRRRAARKAAENARILEEQQRQALEDERKQTQEAEERRVRREARRAEKAAEEAAVRKVREESEAAALKEAESRRRRRRDSVREHEVRPSTRDSKSGVFSLPRSFTGESANKVSSFTRAGTGGSRSSGSRDYRPGPSSSRHSDGGSAKGTTSVPKSDAAKNDDDEEKRTSSKSTKVDTKESSEPHSHRKHRRRSEVEQPRSTRKEGDRPGSSRNESGKHSSSRREGERRVPRTSEKEESKKKPGFLKRIFG